MCFGRNIAKTRAYLVLLWVILGDLSGKGKIPSKFKTSGLNSFIVKLISDSKFIFLS